MCVCVYIYVCVCVCVCVYMHVVLPSDRLHSEGARDNHWKKRAHTFKLKVESQGQIITK